MREHLSKHHVFSFFFYNSHVSFQIEKEMKAVVTFVEAENEHGAVLGVVHLTQEVYNNKECVHFLHTKSFALSAHFFSIYLHSNGVYTTQQVVFLFL